MKRIEDRLPATASSVVNETWTVSVPGASARLCNELIGATRLPSTIGTDKCAVPGLSDKALANSLMFP
jgi:hypothetical protein